MKITYCLFYDCYMVIFHQNFYFPVIKRKTFLANPGSFSNRPVLWATTVRVKTVPTLPVAILVFRSFLACVQLTQYFPSSTMLLQFLVSHVFLFLLNTDFNLQNFCRGFIVIRYKIRATGEKFVREYPKISW